MNQFRDRDLPYGEKGEGLILELILKKYKTAYKQDGYHKEYDIMIPEINKTVEVKRDAQTDSTGNIFIESSCQNVKSGISATTANIFAYITDSKIYWIETENINKCIKDEKILKNVGFRIQGKKIDAYLIPTSIFEKYCIRIDKLTEEHKCQLNSNKAQR